MAKPLSLPRWADVGGEITVPSSGKQDIGWIAEKPARQYFNWWMNLVYQWLVYLSNGSFEGASSFNSTLSVAGVLTASLGITMGANQHVTISGTGRFKHGNFVRVLTLEPMHGDFTSWSKNAVTGSLTSTAASSIRFRVTGFDTGVRIRSIAVGVHGDGFVNADANLNIFDSNDVAVSTMSGSVAAVAAYPIGTNINITGIDTTFGTNSFVLHVNPDATGLIVHSITVTYDRP